MGTAGFGFALAVVWHLTSVAYRQISQRKFWAIWVLEELLPVRPFHIRRSL